MTFFETIVLWLVYSAQLPYAIIIVCILLE